MRPGLTAMLAVLVLAGSASCGRATRPALPDGLSDADFRELSGALSEPAGVFTHSENLVSNEPAFAETSRRLRRRGGAYIGVGPEQNFSFLAALRPDLAFIVDIRRENRSLHLLYKALFEMSADRSEFLFRLFSRAGAAGAGRSASVDDLFAALERAPPDAALVEATLRAVHDRLTGARGLPLDAGDLEWMAHALRAFALDGPDIHYGRSLARDAAGPSYRALMTAADAFGRRRSFLATDDAFQFVKGMHARNAIVPIVGDFGGPQALRAVGEYIRRHGGRLEALYGSNVEVYLTRAKMASYCASLATLPYGPRTYFIHNKGVQPLADRLRACDVRR